MRPTTNILLYRYVPMHAQTDEFERKGAVFRGDQGEVWVMPAVKVMGS